MMTPKGSASRVKQKRLYQVPLVLILLTSLTGMSWPQPSWAAGVHQDSTEDPGAADIEAMKRGAWSYQLSSAGEGVPTHPLPGLEVTPPPAAESALSMASGGDWWGMQLYGSNLEVARMQQIGTRWIRMPLQWMYIEPANTTPENYGWSPSFDAQVAQLSASNIKIIFTLTGNPSWAATYPGGPIDKVNISELVQFMTAAVAHYSVLPYNVKHWEIYNEPDNANVSRAEDGGWGYFGDHPEKYVEVLAALYQPMKQVDPQAQILLGGLAYDNWSSGFVKEFLDGVLALGGGAYFDLMNFHYFTYYREVWEPYGTDIIGKTNYIRDKLADYGVTKPTVVTESCRGSNGVHGTEELQAQYVAQLFARSQEADLGYTIWFWLWDFANVSMECGLLRTDGTVKPSWYAYQALSRQLTGTEYVRTLPASETGSSQIEAYEFQPAGGSYPVLVAWTNDNTNHNLSVAADYVVVVDKLGDGRLVRDRDDGTTDGRVRVTLGPSPVYVRVQDANVPLAAPRDLAATFVEPDRIDLAWEDHSSNESAYVIERSTDNGLTWSQVATVAANVTSYPDLGLACGTTFSYRVRAYHSGSGQYSDYSNVASANIPPCGSRIVTVAVRASSDDAYETKSTGTVSTGSSSLNMTSDNTRIIGVRFRTLPLPPGAVISSAYLEFTGYTADSGATSLTIHGQADDNALAFTTATKNISSRSKTTAAAAWTGVPAWVANGVYRSPELKAVVQEVVNRAGWAENNALAFIVSGSGQRRAYSYEGSSSKAARLRLVYTVPCYSLTTSVAPAGSGSVAASPAPTCAGGKYYPRTVVQLTAQPAPAHLFSGWSGACTGTGACSVTMNANKTVTANFSAQPTSVLGDVNAERLANSTDALIILSADAGINTSQFCPMNCGDVNADGLVNSTDALIILSYDAGMTVPFPVGQLGCPSSVTQPAGCTPSGGTRPLTGEVRR